MKLERALIVRDPHISRILSGLKTWEIRGSNTKIRGLIGLIKSGSGLIVGTAELVDSIPVDEESLRTNFHRHLAEPQLIRYPNPHAWVLKNAKLLNEPIPYKHKQGIIIWVKL